MRTCIKCGLPLNKGNIRVSKVKSGGGGLGVGYRRVHANCEKAKEKYLTNKAKLAKTNKAKSVPVNEAKPALTIASFEKEVKEVLEAPLVMAPLVDPNFGNYSENEDNFNVKLPCRLFISEKEKARLDHAGLRRLPNIRVFIDMVPVEAPELNPRDFLGKYELILREV